MTDDLRSPEDGWQDAAAEVPERPDDPMCSKHGLPVALVVDPFMRGVWNETHMVWLCPECESDRADDI